MLRICSLGSGSKGNSLYVENEDTQVLIDCGFSFADLKLRLESIGGSFEKIKGILITHEHVDHIRALKLILKNYDIKVYVHKNTYLTLCDKVGKSIENAYIFEESFQIDNIKFFPILVSHDSSACVAYRFTDGVESAGILTDLGEVTPAILNHFAGSKLVFVESNHDENMLKNNPNYPAILKRRILSNKGHLSNRISAIFMCKLAESGTKQFMLMHLSEENNQPRLAYTNACAVLMQDGFQEGKDVFVDVASQYHPNTIFRIK